MRSPRLTIGRRLAVLGSVGLAVALITNATWLILSTRADDLHDRERTYQQAQQVVRELDTRASELKVDGYKALVRPDPKGELEELADDTSKATALLDELEGLPLDAGDVALTASMRSAFSEFVSQINQIIQDAIEDQDAAQAGYEKIQTANDSTDTAVGDAEDRLDERRQQIEADVESTYHELYVLVGIVFAIGAILVVAATIALSRSTSRRMSAVVAALDHVAEGDLRGRLSDRGTDEVGDMSRALDSALDRIGLVFTRITGSAEQLASAAGQLNSTAAEVTRSAEETSTQAEEVARTADDVSQNVQAVAAGGEEMGESISEIARNAQQAAQVAVGAVQQVETTTETMSKLGESSREIGDVVRLITSIAEQTNLLALNATIEAARAGDAGKGFAVVADEVKQLAQETARATEDISNRVETIQQDADHAAQAISEIAGVITRINEFQTTIASAVEEQTATTQAISAGVGVAATGSGRIAATISGVASAAGTTALTIGHARDSAEELARISDELAGLVAGFRVS